jgi:Kef-type K+ transport system membrane component KefB
MSDPIGDIIIGIVITLDILALFVCAIFIAAGLKSAFKERE